VDEGLRKYCLDIITRESTDMITLHEKVRMQLDSDNRKRRNPTRQARTVSAVNNEHPEFPRTPARPRRQTAINSAPVSFDFVLSECGDMQISTKTAVSAKTYSGQIISVEVEQGERIEAIKEKIVEKQLSITRDY